MVQLTAPSRRISLIRTAGEWDAVEKRLETEYKADFHAYLRRESSRIVNLFKECHECVTPAEGEMLRRRHNIPVEIYEKLQDVATLMRKPVSTVVDEMLISPLLWQHKDAAL